MLMVCIFIPMYLSYHGSLIKRQKGKTHMCNVHRSHQNNSAAYKETTVSNVFLDVNDIYSISSLMVN